MGQVTDNAGVITFKDRDLTVDSNSTFTGAGVNTLSGTNTLSGATTISGALTISAQQICRAPVAKTASYTVTAADSGVTFTNTGDTDAITFTLPAVATSAGLWYKFIAVADFALAVAGPADTLVAFNSNALTSVKYATAGEIIGGGFEVICDGTNWLVFPAADEAATVTYA